MTPLFAHIAGGLSALWCFVHVFIGGRDIARPLRDAKDLSDEVRGTAWLCWHYVSFTLALMAAVFVAGAVSWNAGVIWAGTVLATGFAIVGLLVPRLLGVSYRDVPQGFLFVPVAIPGVLAL